MFDQSCWLARGSDYELRLGDAESDMAMMPARICERITGTGRGRPFSTSNSDLLSIDSASTGQLRYPLQDSG
jgi:hypothetical protein